MARLHLEPRHRRRLTLLWVAYGAAAVALGVTLALWYAAVRRDLASQSERTVRGELMRVKEKLGAGVEGLRHRTIAKLAGLHEEGLGHALRQWDDNVEEIVGTFEWQPAAGFSSASRFPAGVSADEIVASWREFRQWRFAHPGAAARDPGTSGTHHTLFVRTTPGSDFTAAELGYQAENLDTVTYSGGTADPWAGWCTLVSRPESPWIVWYMSSTGGPVRGCFVAKTAATLTLEPDFADHRLARVRLTRSESERGDAAAQAITAVSAAPFLIGYQLVGADGELVIGKRGSFRLLATIAAGLVALVLLGSVALARFSRRQMREAGRKADFVAHVSHELRTPLTSIRMFGEMLQQPELPPEKRHRYADRIRTESERLTALIERLLAFSSLERGRSAPLLAVVDVGSRIAEVLEEIAPQVHAAGMQLTSRVPPQPMLAWTDPSLFKQALLNLVDNAVKYARTGGIVRIAAEETAHHIAVQVADEGPGIPRDIRERVFEPFFQGTSSLTDKPAGLGLGLTLTREQLGHAGAEVVLRPSAIGAVFEIRLPKPAQT